MSLLNIIAFSGDLTIGNLSGRNQLIFDGNSQTFGTEMSNPDVESYPARVFQSTGSAFVSSGSTTNSRKFDGVQFGWNFGVPSQETQDMIDDGVAQIDSLYDAVTYDRNILIAWCGTNDLYFNQDPTNAYNRIVTYCQARQSAGWYVVFLDIIDRNQTTWEPGYSALLFEDDRQEVNTSVKANFETFADKYINIGDDPNIGADGAADDSTYFTAGKVHLTEVGNSYLAGIVYDELLLIP